MQGLQGFRVQGLGLELKGDYGLGISSGSIYLHFMGSTHKFKVNTVKLEVNGVTGRFWGLGF